MLFTLRFLTACKKTRSGCRMACELTRAAQWVECDRDRHEGNPVYEWQWVRGPCTRAVWPLNEVPRMIS